MKTIIFLDSITKKYDGFLKIKTEFSLKQIDFYKALHDKNSFTLWLWFKEKYYDLKFKHKFILHKKADEVTHFTNFREILKFFSFTFSHLPQFSFYFAFFLVKEQKYEF